MGFLSDLVGGITGSTQAKAAQQAGQLQQQEAQLQAGNIGVAGQQASARFDPLGAVGQQGIDLAGFLTDPNQQASFLQNNPIFDAGLQNANRQTQNVAATRGRLSAGDTLQELSLNPLQVGQPLIDRQNQNIFNLLGIGQNVAGQQAGIDQTTAAQVADLLTGGAAAQAAGKVGAADARSGTLGNIIALGSQPLGSLAPSGSIFGGIKGLF